MPQTAVFSNTSGLTDTGMIPYEGETVAVVRIVGDVKPGDEVLPMYEVEGKEGRFYVYADELTFIQ